MVEAFSACQFMALYAIRRCLLLGHTPIQCWTKLAAEVGAGVVSAPNGNVSVGLSPRCLAAGINIISRAHFTNSLSSS